MQDLFEFMLTADTPERVIGDKASDSDKLDDHLACQGTDLIAPHRSNRRPENVTQDGRYLRRYRRRWTVERTIAWFQNYRRLCIRWEKSATLFQGFLHLSCSLLDEYGVEVEPGCTVPPDGLFDGDGDVSFYQLSDTQLSVHSIVADGWGVYGRVIEELEYEPYGQSRRTAQGDFNRNGEISVQDSFDFLAARFAGDPSADENDDGTVSVQDIFDFLAEYLNPDATPRDRLSSAFFDNPYGYCGYYGDAETAAAQVLGPARRNATTGAVIDGSGCLYHVRHRVYDPSLGRWLTRDPAGFVDGMNLYEYCAGSAIDAMDPSGLKAANFKQCMEQKIACGWTQVDAQKQCGLEHAGEQSPGFFDRMRDTIGDVLQSIANAVADAPLPGTLKDLAFNALGLIGTGLEIFNSALEAITDPVGTIQSMWDRAKAQEAHHAARGGRDPTRGGAVFELLAEALGGNDLARAIFGYDSAEDRMMTATERWAAGLSGGGSLALMGLSPAALTRPVLKACFVAGTLVLTTLGGVPIDEVRIGDRVWTQGTISALESEPKEIPGEGWTIRLLMADPDEPDRRFDVELLRSSDWLAREGVEVGCYVPIELPVLGWNGWAEVTGLEPWGGAERGPGRLVTGTFRSHAEEVVTVKLKSDAPGARASTIACTSEHPLYSLDRDAFVAAGELVVGENLQTATGSVTVAAVARESKAAIVYNIEVEGESEYLVGHDAVRVHNECAVSVPITVKGRSLIPKRGNGGRGGGPDHAHIQADISRSAGGRQEVRFGNRFADNVDSKGNIHQVGNMRRLGGLRPSGRERRAIEDIRSVVGPNVRIIFHDKRGRLPSLIDPDMHPRPRLGPQ